MGGGGRSPPRKKNGYLQRIFEIFSMKILTLFLICQIKNVVKEKIDAMSFTVFLRCIYTQINEQTQLEEQSRYQTLISVSQGRNLRPSTAKCFGFARA